MTHKISIKEVIHKAVQDEIAGQVWYESRHNEERLRRQLVKLEERLVHDLEQSDTLPPIS